MNKLISSFVLVLALLGAATAPAAACSGTVHLPGCGQSGYYC